MTTKAQSVSAARLWLVLARAHGSIVDYIESAITAEGLGVSDFAVLEVLLHKGPLTISAIGEKVLLASASMTSAIDRLEKRGLVRRTNCSSDRRIRIVELTDCGKASIEGIYARHEADLEKVSVSLSSEERKVMYEGLKKLGRAAQAAVAASKDASKEAGKDTSKTELEQDTLA
jgi:MarR family 2-MHQ and catechol resistance regulon transcriptional repressor